MLLYQTVTQLCIFCNHFECNGSLQVNHGRCQASVPIADISAIAFHITHLSYTTFSKDLTDFYLVALFMRANIIIYRACVCIAYLNSAGIITHSLAVRQQQQSTPAHTHYLSCL